MDLFSMQFNLSTSLMFRSLLKWAGVLDFFYLSKNITVVPMQWFSLGYFDWIEAKVRLIPRLQEEIIEHLWTVEETSCLH